MGKANISPFILSPEKLRVLTWCSVGNVTAWKVMINSTEINTKSQNSVNIVNKCKYVGAVLSGGFFLFWDKKKKKVYRMGWEMRRRNSSNGNWCGKNH